MFLGVHCAYGQAGLCRRWIVRLHKILHTLRAHLSEKFPRFVYHDGVLESLDDRKKENLLTVVRRYADLGLQPVITLIDSDLPVRAEDDAPVFTAGEIVVTLHDEGDRGRIFKMRGW